MIKRLHKRLFETKSAFAEVSIAAIIVWVGSLLCVIGDLIWLAGDMMIQIHTHHYIVGSFLTIALLLIAGSGIWLYRGLNRDMEKHIRIRMHKHIEKNFIKSKRRSKKNGKSS